MTLPGFRSIFTTRDNPDTRAGSRPHVFPDPARNLLVVIVGEFCGTFMFLLLAYIGTQTALNQNSPGNPDAPLMPFSLLMVAFSFGASLGINVWIFYRVTGGMFNPAVTLGLLLVGAVKPVRAAFVLATQIVAAIAAAAVADGLIPGPLTVGNKLSDGVSIVRGLFLEMFLTAQLVLTIYFLAVEKHRATYLAPIGIGTAAFIAHICGTNYTGTSINPARSFGPDVITSFPGYHWIFWLGPFMGSLVAWGCYTILKWLEYQTANPGQDAPHIDLANKEAQAPTDADVNRADKYFPGNPPPGNNTNAYATNFANYGGNSSSNNQYSSGGGHTRTESNHSAAAGSSAAIV